MGCDYESGRAKLEKLIEWYTPNEYKRNEATTRLYLIDTLFFECLGWDKDDVVTEEYSANERVDYIFSAPRRILIVEAKREGNYFELPAGNGRIECSIPVLSRDYPNVKAALDQVTHYCQTRGVPFGVVCNGHQIISLVASRSDGLEPLKGKALVFSSLNFMLENFLQLWQILSKPGIEEKNLQTKLVGAITQSIPAKLSVSIPDYPGVKNRNVFQTDLQVVSELVLEDITRHRELETRFLAECYCQSGALSQHALISKHMMEAKYAALFDSNSPGPTVAPAISREGISPDLLSESLSRRPILLIGDMGVGKTSFIKNLINVDAATLFKNALSFYIDLGSNATLSENLKDFIPIEMIKQLREEEKIDIEERNFVRGVYNIDLERFSKSIYADLRESAPGSYKDKEIAFLGGLVGNITEHLRRSLSHLSKGRKKQIVIFLDNADQRDDEIQQAVFLIAQELAENWPATVFVALRPETFHRSAKVGALSGYHPKAFTISPPRIDTVIEKRLRFAIKLASGEIPITSLPGNIQANLTNLNGILRVFLDSFERNKELKEFIENISGGNVRLALDLVKGFFGSGHVDTEKIINIYYESGSYYIPLHEFIRGVIYGDSEDYHPDRSPIANLFDVSQHNAKEHFLLPLTIGFLLVPGNANVEEGFVDNAILYEKLQSLGFLPEQIDNAIIRGVRKKLIETSARRMPQPGQIMPQAFRATTVGAYHITRLCHLFSYIDAIITDTPIFDADNRKQLINTHHIKERLDRAEVFRKYLDSQWLEFGGLTNAFDWSQASDGLC